MLIYESVVFFELEDFVGVSSEVSGDLQGPVDLSAIPDRTNLRGAIEVIKYLTGIISANRLADLERELQELIEKCKDDQALYTAIQIASGLKYCW